MLIDLNPTITLSDLIRELKSKIRYTCLSPRAQAPGAVYGCVLFEDFSEFSDTIYCLSDLYKNHFSYICNFKKQII